MANIVEIPFLNPIRFVPVSPNVKSFDSHWFSEQIKSYEQEVDYPQKWQKSDTIYLQINSNFAPIQMDMVKCSGELITTFPALAKPTGIVNPQLTTYEISAALGTHEEGRYYFVLKVGSGPTLEQFVSEPQEIAELVENSILFQYKHEVNDYDVIFKTGIHFGFRCEAVIERFQPGFKSVAYVDQIQNLTQLSADTFRQYKLVIGDGAGVPDWVADKVNEIMRCSEVLLNGYQYVRLENSALEANRADLYPMAGWTMDIREAKKRNSLRSENNFSPATNFTVVYDIETDVFGTFNGDPAGNNMQIVSTE